MKILQVATEFYADGQKDMSNLIVAFRNFMKSPHPPKKVGPVYMFIFGVQRNNVILTTVTSPLPPLRNLCAFV